MVLLSRENESHIALRDGGSTASSTMSRWRRDQRTCFTLLTQENHVICGRPEAMRVLRYDMWDEYRWVRVLQLSPVIDSPITLHRLIAIMLGRLEMSIDECIEAFTSMMNIVFVRSHRLPFRWTNGKVQARYDTNALERCIANVIRRAGHGDSRMRVSDVPTCKTYAPSQTPSYPTII